MGNTSFDINVENRAKEILKQAIKEGLFENIDKN